MTMHPCPLGLPSGPSTNLLIMSWVLGDAVSAGEEGEAEEDLPIVPSNPELYWLRRSWSRMAATHL